LILSARLNPENGCQPVMLLIARALAWQMNFPESTQSAFAHLSFSAWAESVPLAKLTVT
jgi:hypothetical protein